MFVWRCFLASIIGCLFKIIFLKLTFLQNWHGYGHWYSFPTWSYSFLFKRGQEDLAVDKESSSHHKGSPALWQGWQRSPQMKTPALLLQTASAISQLAWLCRWVACVVLPVLLVFLWSFGVCHMLKLDDVCGAQSRAYYF